MGKLNVCKQEPKSIENPTEHSKNQPEIDDHENRNQQTSSSSNSTTNNKDKDLDSGEHSASNIGMGSSSNPLSNAGSTSSLVSPKQTTALKMELPTESQNRSNKTLSKENEIPPSPETCAIPESSIAESTLPRLNNLSETENTSANQNLLSPSLGSLPNLQFLQQQQLQQQQQQQQNQLSQLSPTLPNTTLTDSPPNPEKLPTTPTSASDFTRVKPGPKPGGSRKPRTVFSDLQIQVLSEGFDASPYPSELEVEKMSDMTGLDRRVVIIWFQNRRSKYKKKGDAHREMMIKHRDQFEMLRTIEERNNSGRGPTGVGASGFLF